MGLEIEKKFRITDGEREEIVEALEDFGAEFVREDFEENTLFSNDDLFERNAIVRIRRIADKTILTFKQRIVSTSDAKHQTEYESEVSDADAVRSIIESIGLRAAVVYEKRRKIYKFRSVEVVMDELPFGEFMEIEGPISAIAEAELLFAIEDLKVENETYPRLAAKYGTRNGEVVESRFTRS